MTTPPSRSYTKLAAAIILAAILVSATLFLAISGAAKTVTETAQATTATVTSVVNHTTTVSIYENVEMTEICTAVSYVVPDTVGVSPTTITITSGSVTSHSVSYSTVYPGTYTLGTYSYSTSTYGNYTAGYVSVSTSPPSMEWTLTDCTFNP